MEKRIVVFLSLCLLIGLAAAGSSSYLVAGSVDSADGYSSTRTDFSTKTVGNMTSLSGYSTQILGRGDLKIASEMTTIGDRVNGTIGAILTQGNVLGSASGFVYQAFIGENLTPEGLPEKAICVFDDPEPEELDFQNQYCDSAETSAGFWLSSGQAAISTEAIRPAYSLDLMQAILVEGDGSGQIQSGYLDMRGEEFNLTSREEFTGSSRMGGSGMSFSGGYSYRSMH